MSITLKPESERYAREQAKEQGYNDPGEYLELLLERDRQQRMQDENASSVQEDSKDWAWQAIKKVTGSATGGLTTDQIMAETRSEV